MKLKRLNDLSPLEARHELSKCCGARRWVEMMVEHRPFANQSDLFNAAEVFWFELDKEDWLEAFSHHPKIGDTDDLAKRFPETAALSAAEQKNIAVASTAKLAELKRLNDEYERKFGFIFIICAQNKSIDQFLTEISTRIKNRPDVELENATREQNKITRLRLEGAF